MNIRKHIPNTLTCVSLAFGCYACILALDGNYLGAMIAIFIASIFDFSDGFAARILNAFSTIGKDLDSLADMVSFGVAPGMILFDFIDRIQKTIAWSNPFFGKAFLIMAFLIPVFSALRLAKFNNDKRQTTSFIGLPVPANAIFWAPLIYTLDLVLPTYPQIPTIIVLIIISCIIIVSSFLLVSEIPMFSLKVKTLAWKGNELRYILLISAIGLIIWLGLLGIAVTILLYILLSIFNKQR